MSAPVTERRMTTPTTREHVELDVDLDAEVACEAPHDKPHWKTCSGDAKWSMPPLPCGCLPRLAVCEATGHVRAELLALLASSPFGSFRCSYCRTDIDARTWLARWTRL